MLIKRISRSGGSLVISLPKNFLSNLNLHQGSYVTVELTQGKSILMKPLERTLHSKSKGGR